MRVWIDQDLCTGDGLCAEIAPAVFDMHDDGLAYVKGIGQAALCGPDGEPVNKGSEGMVEFATILLTQCLKPLKNVQANAYSSNLNQNILF